MRSYEYSSEPSSAERIRAGVALGGQLVLGALMGVATISGISHVEQAYRGELTRVDGLLAAEVVNGLVGDEGTISELELAIGLVGNMGLNGALGKRMMHNFKKLIEK